LRLTQIRDFKVKTLLEKFSTKRLFFVSLGVAGCFCLLCLNAYIVKSDFVLIGVFQELLTLPLMLIQLALFVLSIMYCMNDKFRIKSYSLWTFLILLVSNSLFLGSIIAGI
jgi:hypothetical protein